MSEIEHPRITEVGRLLAEIDRLREALEGCRAEQYWMRKDMGKVADERDRLREALTYIVDLDSRLSGLEDARAIAARAALAKEVEG